MSFPNSVSPNIMPFVQPKPDRALISVSGEDAAHFLHNLITCDTEHLAEGEAAFGALLTPQGKIMFDFFVIRRENDFLLDVHGSLADDLLKRLMFYKLRAKVELASLEDGTSVYLYWGYKPPEDEDLLTITDPRLSTLGYRVYSSTAPDGEPADHASVRIRFGMPEGGRDFVYGDAFPHEALMDQFKGVDFKKGCYVGQEVVSRMQHRSTARKRILRIEAEAEIKAGAEILAGSKVIGSVGSASHNHGLAMLRMDKVKKALDDGLQLTINGAKAEVTIPEWASFSWPE